MTEPPRVPPAPVSMDWTNQPTWCTRCETYQATAQRPVCPVCLDDRDREVKAS